MSVRSVIAVLGGLVIISFLSQLLEVPAVRMLSDQPLTNMEDYLAARNQPAMHLVMLAIAAATGILAGYIVAKIAGRYELAHAGGAALLQTLLLVRGYAAEGAEAAFPAWVRAGIVLVTIGALLLGAEVRARAARLAPKEVES